MTDAAKPLEPIQTGLLKSMRYIKRSYNSPLEHGQDLRRESVSYTHLTLPTNREV